VAVGGGVRGKRGGLAGRRCALASVVAEGASELGKDYQKCVQTREATTEAAVEAGRVQHRKERFWLRKMLWPLQRSCRAQACGRLRIAERLTVGKRNGKAHYHGLLRCGCVHTCPVCSFIVAVRRVNEVRTAFSWWRDRGGDTYLTTFTVRHHAGQRLKASRAGLSAAYRRMKSGRAWRTFCSEYGWQHSIRSLEVTTGPSGWHPHLHVALLGRKLWCSPTD
jgi:hypothetical protein